VNRHILVVGIVFLFIGVCFQPAFANNMENNPPDEPSDPYPNYNISVPICVNLSWICEDPDGDNVTFDVWFGDSELGVYQVLWNQTENWFWVYDLDFLKKYYWYIVAWDEHGAYTVGPIWSFITEENLPPNTPVDPHPFHGDTAVPCEGVVLCWNGSDPNLCDTLRYDLYFDDFCPPLTKRLWESYDNCWEIDFELDEYEEYCWRVDTWDREGLFTEGNVWTFYTGDNNPPTDPIIDGKKTGKPNEEHDFTFVSTDSENHFIQYRVKWGDGTEELTELYPNGTTVTLSHSWNTVGDKVFRAMAIDEYGAGSEWSRFNFVVSRDKIFNLKLFELLFVRFLYAIPILQKLIQQLSFGQ
jgi:hypothetical protein